MHWLSQLGHHITQCSRVPSRLHFFQKKLQYLLAANFELNQGTKCIIDEQPDTCIVYGSYVYISSISNLNTFYTSYNP